ncbi:MAG: hypothetical protein LBU65_04795 [Planctomycetaceae bacterium]|nr:hypothetical protein [Planctomycetaceae bacterium]
MSITTTLSIGFPSLVIVILQGTTAGNPAGFFCPQRSNEKLRGDVLVR